MKELNYCDLCSRATYFKTVLSNIKDNEKVTNQVFQIVKCEECGHCFLWPMPDNISEVEKFYPRNYYAHTSLAIQKILNLE
jgi:uncharacterized Zn finger protein